MISKKGDRTERDTRIVREMRSSQQNHYVQGLQPQLAPQPADAIMILCIDDSGSLLYEALEKGDQKHKSTYDIYLFVFWVHKKCSLFLEHTINDNNCCEKIAYQQIYVLIFQCIPEIKKCAQIGLGAAYYRIPIDSFHWELYVR